MDCSQQELEAELLYGRAFLERFEPQLTSLAADVEFVALVREIHEEAAERFGGSLAQEKRFASNELYNRGAAGRFPDLGEIVSAVRADGYAMSSAFITVYFAMFLLDAVRNEDVREGGDGASGPKGGRGPWNERDFRLRWPAEYRCEDGHYVRSKNEAIVDNWLYSHGVCHAYEKAVFDQQTGSTLCSDFFIPGKSLYVEVWGMSDGRYESRRAEKAAVYQRCGCKLLGIDGDDVKNVDDVLSRELL